jgi:hypothetical protein
MSSGVDVLRMQPAEVTDATRKLDELASRAKKLMQAEQANLTVTGPGRDEVSARVASTLNDVHAEFGKVADQGTHEIQEIAATLRAHADNIVAAEQDFAV